MEPAVTRDSLSRSVEAARRERVKELTCLYGIAQLAASPGISLKGILQGVVELLVAAGADIDAVEVHGKTPLDLAWERGHQ